MVIGIPGTGTAGLITTIIAFKHGHIVAGILSVIACTGWIIQTVGNGIYYQKVCLYWMFQYWFLLSIHRPGYTTLKLDTHWRRRKAS
jgi:hypothetical protein